MPKLFFLGIVLNLCVSTVVQAQTSLKTNKSTVIEKGFITETVVLGDESSQIFLEFIKGDRVAKALDGQIYDGEILPPVLVDVPAKAPRARMREVLSFEVISDTSEELELIDQFTALHPKDRLRTSLKNQAGERRQGAQLITVLPADSPHNRVSLWHYDPNNTKTPWIRLGGIKGEAPAGEAQVFSAYLYGTGVFTLWDENPSPDFQPSFVNDDIELAEPSPFPSVTENQNDSLSDFLTNSINESEFEYNTTKTYSRDYVLGLKERYAQNLELTKNLDISTLSQTDRLLITNMEAFSQKAIDSIDVQLELFDIENELSKSIQASQTLQQEISDLPDIPENIALIKQKKDEANALIAPHLNKLQEMRALAVEAADQQRSLNLDFKTLLRDLPNLEAQKLEADFNLLAEESLTYFKNMITQIDNDISSLEGINKFTAEETVFLAPSSPNGSQSLDRVIPAVNSNDSNSSLIPATPNRQIAPIPSDLVSDNNVVPSRPSDSAVSKYFKDNVLELTVQEKQALQKYLLDLPLNEETSRQLVASNLNGQNTNDSAALAAIGLIEVAFGRIAQDVFQSIENQDSIAFASISQNQLEQLWQTEFPNAEKIYNTANGIDAYKPAAGAVYQERLKVPEFQTMITLLPKLKEHYQAYYDLPITNSNLLQTNSFQDFGSNEGDLPVAGGMKFPWLLLMVLGVLGFSVRALLKKPY